MTVLVTGGTGLVGSRLLSRLVSAGFDCRALLRLGKVGPAGVPIVEGDLFDTASLARAVTGVDTVVHLAAVFRTMDTDAVWKANRDGTINLIDAVKQRASSARFIMASTSHVYGADISHPGREDDAVSPEHPYPASKVACEQQLSESGLNWSVLRLPFVYGDEDGHLEELPKHMAALKWHPALRMSTIHHRDVATAMKLAISGAMDGRIVNVADDAAVSVHELVALGGGAMQESSAPLTNPWHQQVDISLARSLGFVPTVRTVYQAVEECLL